MVDEFYLLIIAVTLHRYEVESEENRRACVIEIGRRYLGIENEILEHEDKTELDSLEQNNLSSINIQINEKDDEQSFSDSDRVIDILNDELVSQVRQKIQSKKSSSTLTPLLIHNFYRFSKRTF